MFVIFRLESSFTLIYLIEMILKLLVLSPKGYLNDSLNVVNGLVVIISVLDTGKTSIFNKFSVLSSFVNLKFFKSLQILRTMKVLRMSKLLRNLKYMQIIVKMISSSIGSLLNISK